MINNSFGVTQAASTRVFNLIAVALFSLIASALFFANVAHCGQVTLAWDPVTSPGIGGYRLHYGTASGNYASVVDAGNQTTANITTLTSGVTYYFAATAYNTQGTESAYSNEVSFTAPSSCAYAFSPASASFMANGGNGSVSVTSSASCSWTAASTAPWVSVASGASGTGNGSVQYSVAANTGSAARSTALNIAGSTFPISQSGAPLYALTISITGPGSGTVTSSPSGTSFVAGRVVTLTAIPGKKSVFSGWSGACSGTSPTCTLMMSSDETVTASFRRH